MNLLQGLVPAASEALPEAEHRFCARHVYANWSKDWRGGELKVKFWSCAWSTYEEEFIENLNKMAADHGDQAPRDLLKYLPNKWCKAYISARCKCDMVDNNVSETFNSWVNEFRDRPIITLLEEIRKKVMTRIAEYKKFTSTWQGDFSPDCLATFESNFLLSTDCEVIYNGDDSYEVSHGDDQHTVVVKQKACTCRLWDISGVPCSHAIAAIYHAGGNPLEYICNCFNKRMFENAYHFALQPVRGVKFWHCDQYQPIEPPPFKKPPGRPKKNRVRDKSEPKKNTVRDKSEPQRPTTSQKLGRAGGRVTCGLCKGVGHNKKTCKNKNDSPSTMENEGPAAVRGGTSSGERGTSSCERGTNSGKRGTSSGKRGTSSCERGTSTTYSCQCWYWRTTINSRINELSKNFPGKCKAKTESEKSTC
ncbi:uncharacterized protein LOC126682022 [Mercurialis annua]|uniref:uncharacterized protein LOC126682022 n=1 Tax=Mercurialis annua TaxID=3986 RepID=UPI00215F424E|nr:uncharacterized protein LOC126682022 [Mercurialis annua]